MAWIDSGVEVYRRVKPATPPKHLVSYCPLIDPVAGAIFLVDHRLAGLWLPTGGHVDVDEDPARAAARELTEELGLDPVFAEQAVADPAMTDLAVADPAMTDPAVADPVVDTAAGPQPGFLTVTETVNNDGQAAHVDVSLWYTFVAARADTESALQALCRDGHPEFNDGRWWAYHEVLELVAAERCEPHLGRFINKLIVNDAS